jgi:hypothetical protein
MTGMQVAHGWHQGNALTSQAPLSDLLSQISNSVTGYHP